MGIVVENGGVLTTVQDEGRFGYQAYGVSTSGAMDSHAFHIANLLVGNEMTEGALEMTFIGPVLRFTQDNMIAITGGDLAPMLDGHPFPMYQAVLVKEGQKLSFGGMRNGCRGYIAFAGGLDVPLVMGSKSTLLRNNLGGIEGRKLQPGDEIILTIGIVIAKLRIAKLIAGQKHRCASAAHEHRDGIADHLPAQSTYLRVIAFAFGSAVPAAVVIRTIGIVPAVALIVFRVICIQIIHGEAIMASDEVDRSARSFIRRIQIRGADDAHGCRPGKSRIALEEAAQIIAVTAIPF